MNLPGIYDSFAKRWEDFQTAWIISDTHFGDEELAAGIPDRLHQEHLVKLINSCVGKKDILIHLGDVGDLKYAQQLKGYKVLVMGNHDSGATNYKRHIVSRLYRKDKYARDEAIADMQAKYPNYLYHVENRYDHDGLFEWWMVTADNHLFDEVYEGPVMIGEKLLLSHEPISVSWAFNIHGHDHAGKHLHFNAMNVCVDAEGMGYKPINLNQFLKSGPTAKVQTIHRDTIDKATDRKKKRGGKKIGGRKDA